MCWSKQSACDTWKPTGQYGKFTLKQQVAIGKYASLHGNQVAFCHCQIDVLINVVPPHHLKIYIRSKGVWHLALVCDVTYKATNMVHVFKNDAHLRIPFRCCSALPVQTQLGRHKHSSGRHKCSSGISVSEAVPRFGNLCVYKPSALQKKPSMSSEETLLFLEEVFQFAEAFWFVVQAVPQMHFGKTFRMSPSFFWHVPFVYVCIIYYSSCTPTVVNWYTFSILYSEQYASPSPIFLYAMNNKLTFKH